LVSQNSKDGAWIVLPNDLLIFLLGPPAETKAIPGNPLATLIANSVHPNVAKAGGLQSQGV